MTVDLKLYMMNKPQLTGGKNHIYGKAETLNIMGS